MTDPLFYTAAGTPVYPCSSITAGTKVWKYDGTEFYLAANAVDQAYWERLKEYPGTGGKSPKEIAFFAIQIGGKIVAAPKHETCMGETHISGFDTKLTYVEGEDIPTPKENTPALFISADGYEIRAGEAVWLKVNANGRTHHQVYFTGLSGYDGYGKNYNGVCIECRNTPFIQKPTRVYRKLENLLKTQEAQEAKEEEMAEKKPTFVTADGITRKAGDSVWIHRKGRWLVVQLAGTYDARDKTFSATAGERSYWISAADAYYVRPRTPVSNTASVGRADLDPIKDELMAVRDLLSSQVEHLHGLVSSQGDTINEMATVQESQAEELSALEARLASGVVALTALQDMLIKIHHESLDTDRLNTRLKVEIEEKMRENNELTRYAARQEDLERENAFLSHAAKKFGKIQKVEDRPNRRFSIPWGKISLGVGTLTGAAACWYFFPQIHAFMSQAF